MTRIYGSIRGRISAVLIGLLLLAQIVVLGIYVRSSEHSTQLLHDALLAEHMALVARAIEQIPAGQRESFLAALKSPAIDVKYAASAALPPELPAAPRAHAFEHLVGVFLGRVTHQGVRLSYAAERDGARSLQTTVTSSAHRDPHHLLKTPLGDIQPVGGIVAEIALRDGAWLRFDAPLLSVTPFSPWKLGVPLAAMALFAIAMAAWLVHRWTSGFVSFVSGAERLGNNIHAAPLPETGPAEVQIAAGVLNRMQERIRRLLADRTALAAAIAHDLGTPVTRLHLRAHEIEDVDTRTRILDDLAQMKRMITATLEFARVDFADETAAPVDIGSLVQSLCHDFSDAGHDVSLETGPMMVMRTRMTMLRRALNNLLDNAVKYGERARVTLERTKHAALIHIDDDGPGIPRFYIEEAFQPFQRLGRMDEGTGLGLSIARGIVRALGGDVTLENKEGGGMRATVHLPHASAEPLRSRDIRLPA